MIHEGGGWVRKGEGGERGWQRLGLNETSKTAVGEAVVASLPIGF